MKTEILVLGSPIGDFALRADFTRKDEQDVSVSWLDGRDVIVIKVAGEDQGGIAVKVIRALLDQGHSCPSCGCKEAVECDACDGEGRVACDHCEGEGQLPCDECNPDGDSYGGEEGCLECDGEGFIDCCCCEMGSCGCDDCDSGTATMWRCGGLSRDSGRGVGCGKEPKHEVKPSGQIQLDLADE